MNLAPRLPEPLHSKVLAEVLEVARAIPTHSKRAKILGELGLHLLDPQCKMDVLADALSIPRLIWDKREQAKVLGNLALYVQKPQRDDVLAKALAVAFKIKDEGDRAEILIELSSELPESLLIQVLTAAKAIKNKEIQIQVLRELVAYLPEPWFSEVLAEELATVRKSWNTEMRARTLRWLTPHLINLPVEKLYLIWCETLHELANRTRRDLLIDIGILAPVIVALGGERAIGETFQAIQDIGNWWP